VLARSGTRHQVAEGITLVKPGFLQNDEVIAWLDGVEPIWGYLEFGSYCRLLHRPDEDDRAMQLATDLTPAEVLASPIVAAMLRLLQMSEAACAKLTPNGSLSRATVAELAEIVDGPVFDLALIRSVTKVLNERDVWPVELLRHAAMEARLLRRRGKLLVPTTKGQKLLSAGGAGELMALLFEVVFCRINLAHWDGYPVPSWPQSDLGVIAWSLSHVTTTWETPSRLARLATVPVVGVLEAKKDFAGAALELRILRMLALFGLLDAEQQPDPANRFLPARRYRKTALFDRFFSFDVALEPIEGTRH
jgi:hypothetical protein